MEDCCAFFKQYDSIGFFYVPVSESVSLQTSGSGILAHNHIGRIAGDAFGREVISLLLDLYIDQGAVFQFPQKIHDKQ